MRKHPFPLCILVLYLLCSQVVAQEVDPNATAPYIGGRTIALDGQIDPIWRLAEENEVLIHHNDNEPDSPEDCSGRWRALWSDESLFILVEVFDEALVEDSPANQGWHDDRVEIFIDADHSRSTESQGDGVNDFQYNFRWNHAEVEIPVEWYFRDTGESLVGVEYGIINTDTGYRVEAKFPWTTLSGGVPTISKLVGLEVLINDDDDGGTRDSQVAWITSDGTTHIPSAWGTVELGELVSLSKAGLVNPSNSATDVYGDIVLEWFPGDYSVALSPQHRLFISSNLDDITNEVNAIETDDETYALASYTYGTTYYWRVDEANSTSAWDVGDVWQFTTEPMAIALDAAFITVTASSEAQAAMNTINASGMSKGTHNQDPNAMWLSAASAPGETWIQYNLDQAYELLGLHVWNYNDDTGYGIKDAVIATSVSNNDVVETDVILAQGSGNSSDPGAAVALDLGMAQQVQITANNNWSDGQSNQYGLSEVDLLVIPTLARELSPTDGAQLIDPNSTILSWRAGRYATSHVLYISTDPQAIMDETAPFVNLAEPHHTPTLVLGQTYYWRVDEKNNAMTPSLWKGRMQSFTTKSNVLVDDMESYKNKAGLEIWATWDDGFQIPNNGSLVGNGNDGVPETEIVHNGRQSLPYEYGYGGATVSEAKRTFTKTQNWSQFGIQSLSLFFHGQSTNNGGQLYVKINETKITYDGASSDLQQEQWMAWTIDLENMTSVDSLTIGFDGGQGLVYFDNIRLYSQSSTKIIPVQPDAAGLKAHYTFAGNLNDVSGQANHATAVGDLEFMHDATRAKQVVRLGGSDDGIQVPFIELAEETTVSMWINMVEDPLVREWNSAFHADGWDANDLHFRVHNGNVSGQVNGLDAAVGRTVTQANEWIHVAFTLSSMEDSYISTAWLNGLQDGQTINAVDDEVERVMVSLGGGYVGAWLDAEEVIQRELMGKIDDVRIYNRALSVAEIAGLGGRDAPLYQPFE